MKISKELITGIIAILAIGLLVAGVNFLKGNSFFGGDENYYAFFPNSGQLAPASSVTVNGVSVGKVLDVQVFPQNPEDKRVLISFNIQEEDFTIPIGSSVEIGSLDMFNKGLILNLDYMASKGNHEIGDTLYGSVAADMMGQIQGYADPISQKLQAMMLSVDKLVNGVSAFWDETATSEIEGSLKEIQIAIKKFASAAEQIEALVVDEKVKLGRILSNIEQITVNLKRSNDRVKQIVGNVEAITEDLVTADFKGVISNARETLAKINLVLEQANSGEGTLGKLLGDETLYNELVKSNLELQNLMNDIQVHPERYIHFSLFGSKQKSPFSNMEEQEIKIFLDSNRVAN
ncbi:MAG: MlaD family protein [Crocinitomicaceae bacterium]|nr:MlaD family protein [Crocinitomicaceae bacterium]